MNSKIALLPRMSSGFQRQLVYAGILAAAAIALLAALSLHRGLEIESPLLLAAYAAFTVFIMAWGFPAPYIGHTSLDRIAQVSALLIFGPLQAAWICVTASLLWPFLDRKHNPGPLAQKLARAFNITAMFTAMLLAGGGLYVGLGGQVPLTSLGWVDAGRILVAALVMQAVNELMFAAFHAIGGKGFREALSLRSSLFELAAVPFGVLAALLYNLLPASVFLLFVALLTVLILIVRALAMTRMNLETHIEHLLAINRISRAISSSRVLDDVVELIFQECRKLFDFSAFYLVLYDEEHQELDFRLHHNKQGRQPRRRKKLGEGALGWIIENKKSILIEDWETSDSEAIRQAIIIGETPKSVIGVPILYGNRVLGAISIQSFERYTFDRNDLALMTTFADQVAVAIANARLFEELEAYKQQLEARVEERTRALNLQKEELYQLSQSLQQANRQKELLLEELRRKTEELDRQTKEDSLTGLHNRRYMDTRLAIEFKRAERFGHPVTVDILDIDGFKNINDTFSHLLADDVLRIVSEILRRQCRAIDVIARYGGDEFVLCFPETPLDRAMYVCEKIRANIERYDWTTLDPALRVTVSIGLAGAPPHQDLEKLMAAADAKLYAAKNGGRNMVCR